MSKALQRLNKLRQSQKRQAELAVRRTHAELQLTEASQDAILVQRHASGAVCSAGQLQHDENMLSQLHGNAEQLEQKLEQHRQDLVARSRDAKQIEKIIDKQVAATQKRVQRAEQQAVEAWVRNHKKMGGLLS